MEGWGGRWHKASTLLAPVAGGHAYCKQGQRGRGARTLSIVVTKNDILCSRIFFYALDCVSSIGLSLVDMLKLKFDQLVNSENLKQI